MQAVPVTMKNLLFYSVLSTLEFLLLESASKPGWDLYLYNFKYASSFLYN